VSDIPQPDFLNTALVARTRLSAHDLLRLAKALEAAAGREPGPPNGPRPLDVDLLVYDGVAMRSPELTLPHPRLFERRFVLAPLVEIAPDLRPDPNGPSVRELLEGLGPEAPLVERLAWSTPPTLA